MNDKGRKPIYLDPSQSQLLEGLDVWLRLGLVDDVQVKEFSQRYLICAIPELVLVSTGNKLSSEFTETDFASEEIEPREIQVAASNVGNPSLVSQLWQSFREELSVRWLLFLGLFLVVVSSGVLAGTQWNNFSKLGQYLVLWLYTIIFLIAGTWANRQENLSLTARTLQSISLLLIPINFWAMDTFRLWESINGKVIEVIATISLLGFCYLQNRSRYPLLFFVNFLGLSFLHWGWGISNFPLTAIYLGFIATAIILPFCLRDKNGSQSEIVQPNNSKNLILYALSVLLIRGVFITQLPIQKLGLAIGLLGWIVPERQFIFSLRKSRENETPLSFFGKILEAIGIVLLFCGWWIAFKENVPWQATLISGLSLQFFVQRLVRSWWVGDLLALFLIGLQTLFRIRDLLPSAFRETSVNLWLQFTQSQSYYLSIYSVTLFPYILLWIGFTGWLYTRNKPKLAQIGEWLAFGLGIVLTFISLSNNVSRSLNLFLTTATLIYVLIYRRPVRIKLLYFTHLIGLCTICSIIDNFFPTLDATNWAIILLIFMVGEWGISTFQSSDSNLTLPQYWYQSSWFLGFVLATVSYILLWSNADSFITTGKIQYWVLFWLLTPLTLTAIANQYTEARKQQSLTYSSYSLLAVQLLTIWQPNIRIISLWVSAALMLVNSLWLRQLVTVRIQVGFTVAAILVSIWEKWFKADQTLWLFFSDNNWLLINTVTLSCLWLLSIVFKKSSKTIPILYSQASHEWAIALGIWNILQLTIHSIGVIYGLTFPSWQLLLSCLLIITTITYRYWRQPNNLAVYGVLLTIEILVLESILWRSREFLFLATVNLILAFLFLVTTSWLLSKFTHLSHLTALKLAPLFFAIICIFWRLGEFNQYTGVLTLGVAVVGIAVSQRFRQGKPLTYLSFIGISLAVYEGIIYRLLQQTLQNLSTQIMILSLVTVAIGIIYRLIAWWWEKKDYQSIGHINLQDLYNLAHGHWTIAAIFKIISVLASVNTLDSLRLQPLSLALSLTISGYALLQARQANTRQQDIWIYLGLSDAYGTAILTRLLWPEWAKLDPLYGAIACAIAFLIYYSPWRRWGWKVSPWQHMALILPTLTAILTFWAISYISLLFIAVFYGQIALRREIIRWSYVSLVFIDWAILRFLSEKDLTDILYYASILGLSILYIAQIDPILRQPNHRKQRHYWRVAGSGIICLTALIFHQETGLTPGIISLVTIFAGLGFRIRAFLFIGTITFILTVLYQLIVLIAEYAFLKWVVGLIVGIILITIAANFERRREQVLSLLQNWTEQLGEWQ